MNAKGVNDPPQNACLLTVNHKLVVQGREWLAIWERCHQELRRVASGGNQHRHHPGRHRIAGHS